MKTVNLDSILLKIQRLEKAKAAKVDEILFHSKPTRLISETIRNETVIALVAELRDIQDEINNIRYTDVTVDDDLPIK